MDKMQERTVSARPVRDCQGKELVIESRNEAIALLNLMIYRIERSNAGAIPSLQGKNNAIGTEGYYWPLLESLLDYLNRVEGPK